MRTEDDLRAALQSGLDEVDDDSVAVARNAVRTRVRRRQARLTAVAGGMAVVAVAMAVAAMVQSQPRERGTRLLSPRPYEPSAQLRACEATRFKEVVWESRLDLRNWVVGIEQDGQHAGIAVAGPGATTCGRDAGRTPLSLPPGQLASTPVTTKDVVALGAVARDVDEVRVQLRTGQEVKAMIVQLPITSLTHIYLVRADQAPLDLATLAEPVAMVRALKGGRLAYEKTLIEPLLCKADEHGEVATTPGRLDEPALAHHLLGAQIANARDQWFEKTPHDRFEIVDTIGSPRSPTVKSYRIQLRRERALVGEFRLATWPDRELEWDQWGFIRCVPD